MKIAIVGATGLVGTKMIEVLSESDLDITELIPVASQKSVGKTVSFKEKTYKVVDAEDAINRQPNIALFSAGGTTSLELAPKFAKAGIKVIDNSSAWRMDTTKKLIVPEVNASALTSYDMIIANPNCSTIQLVVALAPLHQAYKIKRLVVSTYQSFTGTGKKAVDQYNREKNGSPYDPESSAYPYPIFENCIPQCDIFLDNSYTKEEMKIVQETKKILDDDSIQITATAVRVPVDGGHSESVNIEFLEEFEIEEVFRILEQAKGVTVVDDVDNLQYPMPLYAKNTNDVYVGRIRRDNSIKHGLNMWIVSDNLRKGAATNSIQIADYLVKYNLLY